MAQAAQRVLDAPQADSAPPKKDLSLKALLTGEAFRKQIAMVLPKHVTADRMVRTALTAMMRTPKLLQCTQESFFQCMLTLSQLGLEPDGRRAHLIPRDNNRNRTVECTYVIDYKGLVELVMNTGLVSYVHADLVCDNDVFDYDKGEVKTHKINFREPRGEVYAVYAFIHMKDGTEHAEVLGKDECIRIRDLTPGWKYARDKGETPWGQHEGEMMKKTAFRRCTKWVKLSPEAREILEADDAGGAIAAAPMAPITLDVSAIPDHAPLAALDAPSMDDVPEPSMPTPAAEPVPAAQKAAPATVTEKLREQYVAPTVEKAVNVNALRATIAEECTRHPLRGAAVRRKYGSLDNLSLEQLQTIAQEMRI